MSLLLALPDGPIPVTYPDRTARGAAIAALTAGVFAVGIFSATLAPFDPTQTGRTSYPDFAGRSAPRPNVGPAWIGILGSERWGIDFGLQASVVYPDFPGRKSQPINVGPTWTGILGLERWGIDLGQPPKTFYPDFPYRGPVPLPRYDLTTVADGSLGYEEWGIIGDEESWRPGYPDFPGRKTPPNNVGPPWSGVLGLNSWGLDFGLQAKAIFPDFAGRGPAPLPRSDLTHFSDGAIVGYEEWGIIGDEESWRSLYPDFPGRQAPRPNVGPAWIGILGLDRWGLDLGQPPKSFFPDFPGRQAPRPNIGPPWSGILGLDRWGLDLGQPPKAYYPDFPARKFSPINVGPSVFYQGEPGLVLAVELRFAGSRPDYPDFPGRQSQRPNVGPAWGGILGLNRWGLDFGLEAKVIAPDFPGRRLLLPVSTGLTVVPLTLQAPTLLFWYPNFPDFARGKPGKYIPAGIYQSLPDQPFLFVRPISDVPVGSLVFIRFKPGIRFLTENNPRLPERDYEERGFFYPKGKIIHHWNVTGILSANDKIARTVKIMIQETARYPHYTTIDATYDQIANGYWLVSPFIRDGRVIDRFAIIVP